MSNLFRVSISFFYNVPFNKKDDAKKVRMQWDPKRKMWHIDYTWSNPQGMLDEIYCMVYDENLFKFDLKFFESSYGLEDEEIKKIQTNYDNRKQVYLNKPVLTKQQLEEQDDIKYNELLEHEKKVKAFTKRNNEKKAFEKVIINNTKYMKDDKIDYIKKDAIIKKLKYENVNFDSDSDEEEVKPKVRSPDGIRAACPVPEVKVEYDYPRAIRSKGEYDCFGY
jgi:hypothetical protein